MGLSKRRTTSSSGSAGSHGWAPYSPLRPRTRTERTKPKIATKNVFSIFVVIVSDDTIRRSQIDPQQGKMRTPDEAMCLHGAWALAESHIFNGIVLHTSTRQNRAHDPRPP